MFLLGSTLKGLPIVTLASGSRIADVLRPIIEPSNLEVVALLVSTNGRDQKTLACRDLREATPKIFLVNSEDELAEPDEVVRLQPLLKHPYNLVGAAIRTETGMKLGKVADFTVNTKGFVVQKLYVRQPFIKSLMGGSLSIDRAQIIDVTAKQITVRDGTVAEPLAAMQAATPE